MAVLMVKTQTSTKNLSKVKADIIFVLTGDIRHKYGVFAAATAKALRRVCGLYHLD